MEKDELKIERKLRTADKNRADRDPYVKWLVAVAMILIPTLIFVAVLYVIVELLTGLNSVRPG